MRSDFDILIRGGLVYDGAGGAPVAQDLGILGDKISFVGSAENRSADTVIDASGFAVSPGFIDTHSHSDFTIMADPRALGKVCQGITTEIDGNCGMSSAPLYGKAVERREEDLRELGIKERWNTLAEYFRIIEARGTGLNIAMLAGHGNIRGSVVGYEDRPPSQGEMRQMTGLLSDALNQGARGFSTGLIYPPGIYSKTEELIGIAKELRGRDLIYTSHMRSEGERLAEAVDEVIRIGREADIKVHISHIKTAGAANWDKADRVIEAIAEARRSGVRLTCDRYPYTASSTDLDSIFPAWVFAGGNDEEIRRLEDRYERSRIEGEVLRKAASEGYWKKIIISSVSTEENSWMEGKTISEIAAEMNKGEMDLVFELLIRERLRVGAIFLSMNEGNLRKFLSLPFCMIGSDSSARCFDGPTKQGKPHPRTFGTFPRFLGRLVRDEGLMPLEEALRRSCSLPAEIFGLRDRGQIREGMFADIVVFDPVKIMDKATFEKPYQKPEGISYVIVNGTISVQEGEARNVLPGRTLKS